MALIALIVGIGFIILWGIAERLFLYKKANEYRKSDTYKYVLWSNNVSDNILSKPHGEYKVDLDNIKKK